MSLCFLGIGGGEFIFVALAVLLLFGSSKIPELARMFGKGMNEFKKATDDIKREFNDSTGGIVDDIKKSQEEINREVREIGNSVTDISDYDSYEDDEYLQEGEDATEIEDAHKSEAGVASVEDKKKDSNPSKQ
ncbi:Sec-independent protein translocase subunit TatA/TatB [Saccharicrinis aurantiacus]|uniref:Sec-independent protein translocase subunit TatA/TatB n=1 Tax=Saccharicrinis aurantiacus TaxID=1849719 RepID=UPI0024938CA3|nr:twin-arginine translocase TatA/TatE family subunit [Saccharicrinis aurantiacus]